MLSVLVALLFRESVGVEAFLVTAGLSTLLGWALYQQRRESRPAYSTAEIMTVATLGWTLISLLGALPFFYMAHRLPAAQVAAQQLAPFTNFIDAFFEALSGYTSTGLSLAPSPSSLPSSLQWWRSFLQWVGGVGIIVFISALHPGLAAVSAHYSSDNQQEDEEDKQDDEQQENDEEEEVLPNAEVSWTKIWWIYLIFTFLAIGLLCVQGIPLWEAINHGMTAISTGGFSITDQSLENYSLWSKITVILIIIIGSHNFHLFHRWFTQGAVLRFLKNPQHQLFFALLLLGTFLLYYENNLWANKATAWSDLAFQTTSALGTCGFSTVAVKDWSTPALLILVAAMLIGGATASTTGGVKLFRVILLIKGNIYRILSWISDSDRELHLRFNDRVFSHEESLRLYRSMGVFFFFWIVTYMLTTVVLIHEVSPQYQLTDVLFEAASALGTAGLSVGITDAELSAIGKLSLMLGMLVGRLELMPIVVLFALINRQK